MILLIKWLKTNYDSSKLHETSIRKLRDNNIMAQIVYHPDMHNTKYSILSQPRCGRVSSVKSLYNQRLKNTESHLRAIKNKNLMINDGVFFLL